MDIKVYLLVIFFLLILLIAGCKDKITSPITVNGNIICYEKSYNNYWEIFTNNTNGSNPQNISNYSDDDEYPQWSPDGKYIVFRRSIPVGGPLMYVYDLENKTYANLTEDGGWADYLPQWAPNGKVCFSYQRPLLSAAATYIMNPDGNQKKKILNLSPSKIFFYQDSYNFLYLIDWTQLYKSNIDTTENKFLLNIEQIFNQNTAMQGFNPSLDEILITSTLPDGKSVIATYNINNNNLNILLKAEDGYTFFQVKYSSDYNKIGIIEHNDQGEYLSVLENGIKKRLVHIEGKISSTGECFSYNPIEFSKDGKYIAFSKRVFFSGVVAWIEYLYVVDVTTGDQYYIDKGFYPSWCSQ
jgi:Tol biopolymer transport system component